MKLSPKILSAVLLVILYLFASNGYGQNNSANDLVMNVASINNSTQTGQKVFNRLNSHFGALSCDDKSANYWLSTYSKNSNGFTKHLQNALPLLDYVSREIERLDLPGEYALVPFIESHYNPAARSKLGPAGLWQMIASTAKHNNVIISAHYDGRYSPIDSTQGALKYLTAITTNFSTWQTALMAYNAGSTRVRNSLNAQGLKAADAYKKLPKGLAPHTYAYVLKIKAIACLIAEPTRYGINLPNDFEFTPLQVVSKGKGFVNLTELSQSYPVSLQDLMTLNPSYKKQIPNKSAPGNFLVPSTSVDTEINVIDQSN